MTHEPPPAPASAPGAVRPAEAGVPSEHEELHSSWGHDSFLLEPPGYHDRVQAFLG